MAGRACNTSTQEIKAGRSPWIQGQSSYVVSSSPSWTTNWDFISKEYFSYEIHIWRPTCSIMPSGFPAAAAELCSCTGILWPTNSAFLLRPCTTAVHWACREAWLFSVSCGPGTRDIFCQAHLLRSRLPFSELPSDLRKEHSPAWMASAGHKETTEERQGPQSRGECLSFQCACTFLPRVSETSAYLEPKMKMCCKLTCTF